MEGLTIGLAITAVTFAIVAMFFEIFFYRWQTEQGQAIKNDVSDFAKEMHGLVGELTGRTTDTQETQQKQFQTMLDAFVKRQAPEVEAAVEANTDYTTSDLMHKISHIETMVERSPQSEALNAELGAMRESLSELQGSIPDVVARSLRAATEDAEGDSSGVKTGIFPPRDVIIDLLSNELVVQDEEEAEQEVRTRYQAPLDFFTRDGLLELREHNGRNKVVVTDKGIEFLREKS